MPSHPLHDRSGDPRIQDLPVSPEVRQAIECIGERLGKKYKSTRVAFRDCEVDGYGIMHLDQVRSFFRRYGYGTNYADPLFEAMSDEAGTVRLLDLQQLFGPYINPSEQTSYTTGKKTSTPMSEKIDGCFGAMRLPHHVRLVLEDIGFKLSQRFVSAREAFRFIDSDSSGTVSHEEVRAFFAMLGYADRDADEFMRHVDANRSGYISSEFFHQLFGSSFLNSTATSPPVLNDLEFERAIGKFGKLMLLKYSSVRTAFRAIDSSGHLGRVELCTFFSDHNFDPALGNQIMDRIGGPDCDEINYVEFVNWMSPYTTTSEATPTAPREEKKLMGTQSAANTRLEKVVEMIAAKAQQRHQSGRSFFRQINVQDGRVTRFEMQKLFRLYGYSAEETNTFLGVVGGGSGGYNARGADTVHGNDSFDFDEIRKIFTRYFERTEHHHVTRRAL